MTPEMTQNVLMWGTGRFLRGFACDLLGPDTRVTMVQSTGTGRCDAINRSGGAFPLLVRGLREGTTVDDVKIIRCVRRCLSATDDSAELERVASDGHLAIVISNVTEAGITEDEPSNRPGMAWASTFVGRLTSLLAERFRVFGDTPAASLVILPCELIPRNGDFLAASIDRLAWRWGLGGEFTRWRSRRVPVLNTLVDRIVTRPSPSDLDGRLPAGDGFDADLLTAAEPFALWAIEVPDDHPRRPDILRALRGVTSDPRVVVSGDIRPLVERKLRLLNGAHTACAAIAVQRGIPTVREAMRDASAAAFLRRVLLHELLPACQREAHDDGHDTFARTVLERFANPFLEHKWADIAANSASKAEQRLLPTAREAVAAGEDAPALFAGLAGILSLHRPGSTHAVEEGRRDLIRSAWAGAETGDQVARRAVDVGVFGPVGGMPADEAEEFAMRVGGGLRAIGAVGSEHEIRFPPVEA